jgi:hypothetical protein
LENVKNLGYYQNATKSKKERDTSAVDEAHRDLDIKVKPRSQENNLILEGNGWQPIEKAKSSINEIIISKN